MTAPKNDKARKAWLAGLKDGDEVANVADDGRILGFGPVCRLPHDTCFLFGTQTGKRPRFTLATGKAQPYYWSAEGWIVPLTNEMRVAYERKRRAEDARHKIDRLRAWEMKQMSDDRVLAAAAILWPEASK